MIVCLFKTGEISPFAIINCTAVIETPDEKLKILLDSEYETINSIYDYYYVYDLETDEDMNLVIKLLQNFVKEMENNCVKQKS